MKVLVACEFSGIVRDAFKERGHDAWSCDLLPTEKEGQHIQGDVLEILNDGWDLMIAFPPCTYLAKSSACRLYPKAKQIDNERYKKGLEAKDFFMKFINSKCEKRVVENPVSLKIFNLPMFSQEIEPYQFGHPFSKKTRLWISGLPLLKPTTIVKKERTYLPSSTSKNAYSGKNDKCTRNSFVASKTFSGIAKAMAEQWG